MSVFVYTDTHTIQLFPPLRVSLPLDLYDYEDEGHPKVVAEYESLDVFPEDEEWYEEHGTIWWRELGRANVDVDPTFDEIIRYGGIRRYLCDDIGVSTPHNVAACLGEFESARYEVSAKDIIELIDKVHDKLDENEWHHY